jgi:hypothetical protein
MFGGDFDAKGSDFSRQRKVKREIRVTNNTNRPNN